MVWLASSVGLLESSEFIIIKPFHMCYEHESGTSLTELIWGVHPIAHGWFLSFIHLVMKSRRVSQTKVGHLGRFKTLSHEN
jgi:hypothetical protein